MPQLTPNLSLQTYDLTIDAGVYFSSFRTSLAGYNNSALTKIDTWAGTVNTDILSLKQIPVTTRVSANKDDDYAYNALVTGYTQYTNNSFIALSLDSDNLGSVLLNINALGGKSLLKASTTGTYVNVEKGDLRAGAINYFIYNGVAWVWISALSGNQINIVGDAGNILEIGTDNNIVDSGVSYSTTATADKVVQRTSTGQIKGVAPTANDDVVNKSYADGIDTRIGNLATLKTTDKTSAVSAINENFEEVALKSSFYVSNSEPSPLKTGSWWYNPLTDDLKFRSTSSWISGGGAKVEISETEPSTNLKDGLFWFKPSTEEVSVYITGEGFQLLTPKAPQLYESRYVANVNNTSQIPINITGFENGQIFIVDQDGIVLVKDVNYTISLDNSYITLIGYSINVGDSIHFTNIR